MDIAIRGKFFALPMALMVTISFCDLSVVGAPAAPPSSPQDEVMQRIKRFYDDPQDASAMFVHLPKYDPTTGAQIEPNSELKPSSTQMSDRFARLAGKKMDPEFDKAYCRFLKTHFPGYHCGGLQQTWSTAETNDQVASLAYTWMGNVSYNLDDIPSRGDTELPLWSDDYWKTKFGQTSYRYATKTYYSTYQEAVRSYAQPREWEGLLASFDPAEIATKVVNWSPAEKYDLSIGDTSFSLTDQQKHSGGSSVDVEAWMGLCHGWTAASIMVPRPTKTADLVGKNGLKVTWYPADVRAMLTLAWGNGTALSNFVGGRCRLSNPGTYPSGHIMAQECFDTNPATFHLALGNMIGRARLGFIMDATYDYEVWNQPVSAYQFTYFNPLNPGQTSQSWRDVAVDYDAAFRAHDRFQSPLTRGVRTTSGWDDRGIRKIVGVIAHVTYLIEQQPPDHTPTAEKDQYTSVDYTYDLELHEEEGKLVAKGGEWHEIAHPDFLWIPRKNSFVRTSYDYLDVDYDGLTAPASEVTETARQASHWGYPLCQVLKQLVKQSSGVDAYLCPEPLP